MLTKIFCIIVMMRYDLARSQYPVNRPSWIARTHGGRGLLDRCENPSLKAISTQWDARGTFWCEVGTGYDCDITLMDTARHRKSLISRFHYNLRVSQPLSTWTTRDARRHRKHDLDQTRKWPHGDMALAPPQASTIPPLPLPPRRHPTNRISAVLSHLPAEVIRPRSPKLHSRIAGRRRAGELHGGTGRDGYDVGADSGCGLGWEEEGVAFRADWDGDKLCGVWVFRVLWTGGWVEGSWRGVEWGSWCGVS